MTWELYDLTKDWTQYDDVAAKYPEKVKELKAALPTGSREVPGAAARRLGGDAPRGAAAEHHRRPHRVRLHQADDRHSAGRLAAAAQHVLHHHGRHRGAGRRRRGHAPDLRRPVRRLRLLPAQGQAGLPLEPGRPEAHSLGRPGRARRPASTPWSSTSSTTASARARWPSTT